MRRLLFITLLLVYTAVLFYYSVADVDEPNTGVRDIDKLYHAVAYMVLALLLTFAKKKEMSALFILSVATGFGLLMEVCQHFIHFRNASVGDAVANAIGALAGAYGGVWLRERFNIGRGRGRLVR